MAIFLTFSFIYNVCFAMFAELIYSTMEKIAVFPGSFDPFTVGHEEIVRRGLKLFDKIIIAVGVNPVKKEFLDTDCRDRKSVV